MPEPDLLTLFVEPLQALGFDYMVTGSVASMLYGEPRLTNDVDLVLDLGPADAPKLRAAFSSSDYCCPPETEIRLEAGRAARGHVNILHLPTALKADIYFAGDEWLHRWALPRCRRLEVGSLSVRLAPPEYVVVRKLSFYREGGSSKHIRDVRALLEARRSELDLDSLRVLAAREGVLELWREVANAPQDPTPPASNRP
jgi:hypothetical protein